MTPLLITSLISAVLAASVGFGAAWTLQGRTIDNLKIEAKDAVIQQQHAARAALERATRQVAQAQNNAQARRVVIAAAVDRNGVGFIGLRNTAASVRASAITPDASSAYADTVSELFDRCGQELVRVAGHADGHVNDVQTLIDAWPTPNRTAKE